MRVYVAGPIFTPDHRERARRLGNVIRDAGHEPVIPFPEDAVWPGPEDEASRRDVFRSCLESVTGADALIAVLDGADADSGTCFEVGVAHARGIPVLGIRTDYRTLGPEGPVNVMLSEGVDALSRHADDWDAVARDVEAFLASPPAPREARLVRDNEGREAGARRAEGTAYAKHVKRALVAAAERLAATAPEDEKAPLADVLELVEALIAHRAYDTEALRRVKAKRLESLGGYREGYVTGPDA